MEEESRILHHKGRILVSLCGELDHHAARTLCAKIDEVLYQYKQPQLCVDLSEVKFMDSAGLGLILGRYHKVSALGGEMKLQNPTKQAEKLLRLAGVDRLIAIEGAASVKKEG